MWNQATHKTIEEIVVKEKNHKLKPIVKDRDGLTGAVFILK